MGRYSNKYRTSTCEPSTRLTSHLAGDVSPTPPVRQSVQAQRRLSREEAQSLVAQYVNGAAIHELAGRWGVHRDTVTKQLKRAGVPRRLVGMPPGAVPEAAQLYREWWALVRLARRYGVSDTTVRRHLITAGVVMRRSTDHHR